MNTYTAFNRSLIAATLALLGMSTAGAAMVSKADYAAGKARISADYKSEKVACAALTANAKDICVEEAKAKEKVARADLEFSYTGKPADDTRARVARAESTYAVSKERCDDLKGNDKDVCVKEAKAVEVKALAEAKLSKTIASAKSGAAQDINDADYKVAAEKCDAMAGDAKSSCLATAKARFGKS